MKYLIITVVAISVQAVIMYTLGNKVFGIVPRLKSLIMCGFCALLLSIVLPRIIVSSTSIAGTISFFAIFAIILAGFVVYYDDRKEISSVSSSTSVIEIEINSQYSEPLILEMATENVETVSSSKIIDDKLEDISVYKEDPMSISKPEVMPYTKVLALDDSNTTDLMESKKSQPEPNPALHCLDDLLECAFSYKERGDDFLALDTFKRALNLHQDKGIAPFLVIEIANLLKNKGAYDEAITLLTESRNLPGLRENHGLDQDFINTIAYLRIIKNTLSESYLGYIPIGKIPEEIFKKIDDEFREWRSLL